MEIIIVSICAWALAQLSKVTVDIIRTRQFDFRVLSGTGGMPSSHTAIVTSLATSVAIVDGFKSTAFAIATILALIVMYDAAGVRRSVGKQAVVLNRILKELRERRPASYFEKDLRELIGHTTLEVFVGACLGIAVSYIWFVYLA
jgi:uncharacterized protein